MAIIIGKNRKETLIGTNFNDSIFGLGGADTLMGLGGNDLLRGGNGSDKLFGGAGNDKLFGDSGKDTLKGGSGNDKLVGGTDNDTLFGGSGADELKGGSGDDVLAPGADADADTVNGGLGIDTVDYSKATAFVNVDLFANTTAGAAAGDTLTSIENIIGSDFNDTLQSGSDGSVLFGGAGNDTLNGHGDTTDTVFLQGGAGNDTISGFAVSQDIIRLERGQGVDDINSVFRDSDGDRLLVDHNEFNIGFGIRSSEIVTGAGAQVANQAFAQFLYNETTDELFFDPDGTGGAAAELIATVTFAEGSASLLASDIIVI